LNTKERGLLGWSNGNTLGLCICIILFFTISVIILRDLIFSPGLLIWVDNHVPITSVQWYAQLYRHFFLWDSFHLTGIPFYALGDSYIHYMVRLPFFLATQSIEITLKLFVLFAMTIPAIGMYYMSYKLTKRKIIGFASGFLYMLNPWTVDRFVAGNTDMLIAYGLIPVVFTLVYQSVHNYEGKRRNNYKILLAGIIASIVAIQLQMFYILTGILILYALFLFIVEFKGGRYYKNIRGLLKFSIKNKVVPVLLVIGISFAINAYWIIPLQFSPMLSRSISSHYPPIEELFFLSSKGSPLNALRMSTLATNYADDIMQNNLGPFYTAWIAISFLLVIVLISSLFLTKLSSTIIFFVILLVIGVALSMGVKATPPLDSLYLILFENFPLFYAFRDPSKWVVLVILSYSAILASLLSFLLTRRSISSESSASRIKKLALAIVRQKTNLVLAAISILLVSLALPFFLDGNFGGNIQPIIYPSEYPDSINWLNRQNTEDRLALFPPDFETRYDWMPSSKIDCTVSVCFGKLEEQFYTYPIASTIALRPSFIYPDKANSMTWWLYHTLYNNNTKYAGQLFGLLNTKYFVIRDDAHPASYNGTYVSFADSKIRNYIDKQVGLDLVYQKGNISIYENRFALPHIYNTNNLTLAVGDRNLLNSLTYLNYPVSKYPVVFGNEITASEMIGIMPHVRHLIIDTTKYDDLYFNFLPNKFLIRPNDYVTNTVNSSNWVSSDYAIHHPLYQGYLDSEVGKFIYTEGANSSIKLPVHIPSNASYEIWVRVFKGKDSDNLKFGIDDKYLTDFEYHVNRFDQGFGWLKVGSSKLDAGKHYININSNGFNALSDVAVIPEGTLDSVKNEVHELLKSHDIEPIYLMEGERLTVPPENKSVEKIDFEASNGYAMASGGERVIMRTSVINEGHYDINFHIFNLTEMNDLDILVNNVRVPFSSEKSISTDGDGESSTNNSIRNVLLKQGKNTIELRMKNGLLLDLISLYPSGNPVEQTETDYRKEFERVNPSRYMVHNVEGLPIVVFLETYNNDWHINKNVSSLPVWSYGNAFIIPEQSNDKSLILSYDPEIYYTIGKIISVVFILILAAFAIISFRKSLLTPNTKKTNTGHLDQ
jgi:hypothetical protein